MSKRVISFCLYGNTPKYTHGLIEAIVSYKMLFINWEIWVYVSANSVSKNIIDIIKNFGCNVIMSKEVGTQWEPTGIGPCENNEPMFWRFLPLYEKDIDFFISRDADSRCSIREKKMVDEFISSNKSVHSILDQGCHHGLMGGMCGFNMKQLKQYSIPNLNDFISRQVNTNNRTRRGQDQTWLRESFKEPIVNKDIFIHINHDIIKRHMEKGVLLEKMVFLHNVLLVDCCHIITEHCANFIGRQINVDSTPEDIKCRTNVCLPITYTCS
jgi:hypothetical protein